ncbi:MAG TPA: hypothetical protein VFU45_08730 [Gemmatimonadales bacterium]|nr:hypothetical protein [Gemmatimonadales bacterium]
MAKAPTAGGDPTVTRLLAERDQYAQWMNRLSVASDTVPESVREKVRADYEARLVAVVEQLKQHTDQVTHQLSAQRARLDELTAKETLAQEVLSEAELRHAVGEYDEAQWQKLRGETHRTLVEVREESARISEEIGRLDEVARLISAAPAAAPAAPAPANPAMGTVAIPAAKRPAAKGAAAPAPAPEPVAELEVEPADEEAPKGGKGGKAPRDSARTLFFPSGKGTEKGIDELDFLKSVGGEQGEKKGGSIKPAAVKEQEPVAEAPPAKAEVIKSDATAGKTLKCAECGTMNRPTEWYCERCGAELAAL